MRYHDPATGLDFDSRQDEDDAPCAECGVWTREELLEPCPRGVFPQVGPVCNECAEQLRSATIGDGADRTPDLLPACAEE